MKMFHWYVHHYNLRVLSTNTRYQSESTATRTPYQLVRPNPRTECIVDRLSILIVVAQVPPHVDLDHHLGLQPHNCNAKQ